MTGAAAAAGTGEGAGTRSVDGFVASVGAVAVAALQQVEHTS